MITDPRSDMIDHREKETPMFKKLRWPPIIGLVFGEMYILFVFRNTFEPNLLHIRTLEGALPGFKWLSTTHLISVLFDSAEHLATTTSSTPRLATDRKERTFGPYFSAPIPLMALN